MVRRNSIRVVPAASRLVYSLRDLGYDFSQAVADLVDNSITAGATRVAVDLKFDGPDSWLRIADNGHGMAGETITEAMRYGSRRSYEGEDLGKFGLGLKTASLSQCRRLSVASRNGLAKSRIETRVLDLDHVVSTDRWEIFDVAAWNCDQRLAAPIREASGTVVLWESLDRVYGYKIPSGRRARAAVDELLQQLSPHLGMVFHRFLAGEVDGRARVRILVNGRRVDPWDPFARDEPATVALPGRDIAVRGPEGVGLVRFQPYVLPPREGFSSDAAFHALAGPRKWNAQQGFYIYRANRMIQSGGWSRMRALDEHVKLARASIDFFPDLDAAFEINVAKVRAVLPAELKERLREPVEMLVRVAQATYRVQGIGDAEGAPVEAPASNGSRRAARARSALEGAAKRAGEAQALRRILRELRVSDPGVARMLGWE
jgi:hypothetical protein